MVDPCWARVEGPLAPYVDGFRRELARLGYTPLSSAVQVRLMAQLSNRLAGQGLPVSGLTPEQMEAFFAARRAAGYFNSLTSRSLRAVSYTHLRAHETPEHLVCRLLLEKK